MVSKALLSTLLFVAIFSPVLLSTQPGPKQAGFTSFVAGAVPPPPPLSIGKAIFQAALEKDLASLKPDPTIPRAVYLAGYESLSLDLKAKVHAEHEAIKSRIASFRASIQPAKGTLTKPKTSNTGSQSHVNGPKKVSTNSQTKSKAQTAALKAPKKINNSVPHNAEERKTVQAEVKKLIKQNKARWEHKIAAAAKGIHILGGNKASLGPNYNSAKKLSREDKKAAFEKLDRAAQLKEIARNIYRGIHKKEKFERAVLGWKYVNKDKLLGNQKSKTK